MRKPAEPPDLDTAISAFTASLHTAVDAFGVVLREWGNVRADPAVTIEAPEPQPTLPPASTASPQDKHPEYYTTAEVKKILRISHSTVFKYIKSGKLPSRKLGGRRLIPREALERIGEEQRTPVRKT